MTMRKSYWTAALGIALAAAFFAGCASEERREAALARMGDESPPDFLLGPASAALAGFDGFWADVVSTTAASATLIPAAGIGSSGDTGGGAAAASGQLIGRQGQIIFQPRTTANVTRGKIVRGGMFFIWDSARQKGFVVSEALQGFAPIAAPCQITNETPESQEAVAEAANGHPCHRVERMAALSDGSTVKLTEWRADDLRRFPVRLRTESGGRVTTVDFSGVLLDIPPQELFAPPGGFTQYAGATALINELMIRESAQKKGPTGEPAPPEQTPDFQQQPGYDRRQ